MYVYIANGFSLSNSMRTHLIANKTSIKCNLVGFDWLEISISIINYIVNLEI